MAKRVEETTKAAPSRWSESSALASAAANTAAAAITVARRTRERLTFELVNATMEVNTAAAIAKTRPPHPSGGRVIMVMKVAMIRARTRP